MNASTKAIYITIPLDPGDPIRVEAGLIDESLTTIIEMQHPPYLIL